MVLGGCGAGAALGPAPGDLGLLPDPRLIGEPDLEGLAAGLGFRDCLQTGREVFLKAAMAASLSGEFPGMQDAGWATTITANEYQVPLIRTGEPSPAGRWT